MTAALAKNEVAVKMNTTPNAPPKLSPGSMALERLRSAARGSWPRPSWAHLALEIEPHFAEEARKRQLATLKRGDVLPDVEKVPQREKSRDQAAAAVGVSGADPLEGADLFRDRRLVLVLALLQGADSFLPPSPWPSRSQ